MNITKNEIGLIARMLESYENEIQHSELSEYIKKGELEAIQNLKIKVGSNIDERRGKRGM